MTHLRLSPSSLLVNLNVFVDGVNKELRGRVGDGTTDETETSAIESRVSKVEGELKESRHVGFVEEVVGSIDEGIDTGRSAVEEGHPMPTIIVSVEQDIGSYDGDTRADDDQDHVNDE